MDWLSLVEAAGGGLPAVVILGLGYGYWRKDQALQSSFLRSIEREREHAAELMQTIEAVRQIGGQ